MLTVGRTVVPSYVGEEYIERVGKEYWDWEHYRAKTNGRWIHISAVVKCAVVIRRDQLKVWYDSSCCSPEDTYSRKRGFKESLRRALAFAEHGTPRSPSNGGWRYTGQFDLPMLSGKALRDAVRMEIERMEGIALSRWRE